MILTDSYVLSIKDVDACSGDSGSPLVMEAFSETFDVQVGIVSWGRGCAVYPGVYSRISSGYDWIRGEVCYKSVSPPWYMGCQPEERNPIYTQTDAAGKVTEGNVTTSNTIVSTPSPIAASPTTAIPSQNPIKQTFTVPAIPVAATPIQNPTKRTFTKLTNAPIIEMNDPVKVPASSSTDPPSQPSNASIAVPVPQQTVSNVVDNASINSSSARALYTIRHISLFIAFQYFCLIP
jgi:Trypsin